VLPHIKEQRPPTGHRHAGTWRVAANANNLEAKPGLPFEGPGTSTALAAVRVEARGPDRGRIATCILLGRRLRTGKGHPPAGHHRTP